MRTKTATTNLGFEKLEEIVNQFVFEVEKEYEIVTIHPAMLYLGIYHQTIIYRER